MNKPTLEERSMLSFKFDDGKWYEGVITEKDPKTEYWVTKFEDCTEDLTEDPQCDKDYKRLD